MTGLLAELGKKFADRWLDALLPGLLLACAVVLGWQLRWRHAFDPRLAGQTVARWVDTTHPAGQITALLLGALIASAAAGVLALGVATVIRRLWLLPGHRPPGRWLVLLRQRRWRAIDRKATRLAEHILATAENATDVGPEYARLVVRRDAMSVAEPKGPTWIGDRLRINADRIGRAHGLDLTLTWPRLWPLLPEPLRADITAAQLSYSSAGTVFAWAVLYAIVGILWGPALIVAAGLVVVGEIRARSATEILCQLVESATDLYGCVLAEQLHVPCDAALTPDIGDEINAVLRKERISHASRRSRAT